MIQQTKILPASQVQNNFGALVKQVRDGEYKEIIVENRGEPVVAIVGMEDLQTMREFQEKEKRQKALSLLRQAREDVQARIKNKLTKKEADEIANRFSKELIEDLEKEGKIRFERKSA